MPSPFPGMDPYIEHPSIWPEFHNRMISELTVALNGRLPDRFVALTERHVWLHEPDAEVRLGIVRPDVAVAEHSAAGVTETAMIARLKAPAVLALSIEPRKGNPFVRIIDREDNRVVTVVELLSPANKVPGPDRDAYVAKRSDYLAGKVSVVELDLLRDGMRMPMGGPPPPTAHYYAWVCRSWEFPAAGAWPFTVRDEMPVVPVPTVVEESDTLLPLRECADRVYDGGRYAKVLRYRESPVPGFLGLDAEWVRGRVAAG